jgi:plasmid stabilization system protein ParE
MVYKIVWTLKALQTYAGIMEYLEKKWTTKEVKNFALTIEKKLLVLTNQPNIGSPKNKKQHNIRHTVLHKRVILIYRINTRKKEIELLRFWNTYQNPARLKAK